MYKSGGGEALGSKREDGRGERTPRRGQEGCQKDLKSVCVWRALLPGRDPLLSPKGRQSSKGAATEAPLCEPLSNNETRKKGGGVEEDVVRESGGREGGPSALTDNRGR